MIIHPAKLDLASQIITMDDCTGEVFTLLLNRDALIEMQELPKRIQLAVGRATKIKSRPLECYWWSYLVPLARKKFGLLFPGEAAEFLLDITNEEVHRRILQKCGERDRLGNVITTSEDDFNLSMQLTLVETVRQWLALEGIPTIDPTKNWREDRFAA